MSEVQSIKFLLGLWQSVYKVVIGIQNIEIEKGYKKQRWIATAIFLLKLTLYYGDCWNQSERGWKNCNNIHNLFNNCLIWYLLLN